MPPPNSDNLPDPRDGLSRKERIVLYCIEQIQQERNGRSVPTVMLDGRVVEHVIIHERMKKLVEVFYRDI